MPRIDRNPHEQVRRRVRRRIGYGGDYLLVDLARLDPRGFARLMGLGRAYESQVLIPSVAQRCIGQVRDGGVFLFASEPRLCNGVHPAVLSLGDAHEQAVQVLTSFQHQHSLATGVIGQVGAEKIDWFKEDGTRLCDDVVAGFVFDAVRSVRGLCHTVIVGEALGEALRAVAIVAPKNPSYLLLGPLWVMVSDTAPTDALCLVHGTGDGSLFQHTTLYFNSTVASEELTIYQELRVRGLSTEDAADAALMLGVA